jgi:hypothetical protein
VEEVVELPPLVGDDQVELLLGDQIVEDHEVGHQDLVHSPISLEEVQVVLTRLGFHVCGLARQPSGRRVHPLTASGEHSGDGVLGQPLDLEVRVQPTQLLRDGDVPTGVPEADR